MELNPETTYRRSDQAEAEVLHDEHIILNLANGEYFGTAIAGGFIWENLDGELTLSEIAVAMAKEYGIDEDQAQSDVLEFIGQLLEHGLIVRA